MKKIYSTIMMLAMMVAALNFTACGDDDEKDGGGNGNENAENTITIDGKPYQNEGTSCSVVQSAYRGLYLQLNVISFQEGYKTFSVIIDLPGYRVSDLKVGQIFDTEEIGVRQPATDRTWEVLSGSVLIKDIKEAELTVQFRNLEIESQFGTNRTINGTITFTNSMLGPDRKPLPFDET